MSGDEYKLYVKKWEMCWKQRPSHGSNTLQKVWLVQSTGFMFSEYYRYSEIKNYRFMGTNPSLADRVASFALRIFFMLLKGRKY